MSVIADALQPLLAEGLLTLAGRVPAASLPDALVSRGAGYELDIDNLSRSVLVDFRDSYFITNALAADCSRLATAAFQSVSQVGPEAAERRSLPWSLVKLYYSSFYAGHCLIRMLGESCSYFETGHIDRIKDLLVLSGRAPMFPIERGVYRCVVSNGSTRLACTSLRGGFGSHDSFWNVFGYRMQSAADEVLHGPLRRSDAQMVFLKLTELREALRRRGTYGRLSRIRNELQYRHHHGAWFPPDIRRHSRELLGRSANRWRADPMTIDLKSPADEIDEFVRTCTFIVALCHAMILRVSDRSTARSRSFARLGPIAAIGQLQ